jgi:hypothetical protein
MNSQRHHIYSSFAVMGFLSVFFSVSYANSLGTLSDTELMGVNFECPYALYRWDSSKPKDYGKMVAVLEPPVEVPSDASATAVIYLKINDQVLKGVADWRSDGNGTSIHLQIGSESFLALQPEQFLSSEFLFGTEDGLGRTVYRSQLMLDGHESSEQLVGEYGCG